VPRSNFAPVDKDSHFRFGYAMVRTWMWNHDEFVEFVLCVGAIPDC